MTIDLAPNIAAVLGGTKALRSRPKSSQDWHSFISTGSPIAAVDALKDWFSLADIDLGRLLGISEKTLSRYRTSHATLDPVTSDRLYRVACIAALAEEVLENRESAVSWLKHPPIGLGSQRPIDMMTTSAGAAEVESLLIRIEYGVYS